MSLRNLNINFLSLLGKCVHNGFAKEPHFGRNINLFILFRYTHDGMCSTSSKLNVSFPKSLGLKMADKNYNNFSYLPINQILSTPLSRKLILEEKDNVILKKGKKLERFLLIVLLLIFNQRQLTFIQK